MTSRSWGASLTLLALLSSGCSQVREPTGALPAASGLTGGSYSSLPIAQMLRARPTGLALVKLQAEGKLAGPMPPRRCDAC